MNVMKFFRGGTVEQSTAGILEQLEEEERSKRQQQAEQIARENRATAEHRARNAKTLSDFLKRKNANTTEINRHVVALLLALTDTKKLLAESNNVPFDGSVSTTDDVFGFPYNFPDTLIAAIASAAPQTQWDWSGEGQPKLRGAVAIRVPTFAGDAARTYDANKGPWPPEKPIDGAGTSAMFLPPAS